MKTALTQLIEYIEEMNNGDSFSFLKLSIKAEELLEAEKEQIMEAFVAGDERGTKEIPFNAEQYYQQTFKSDQ